MLTMLRNIWRKLFKKRQPPETDYVRLNGTHPTTKTVDAIGEADEKAQDYTPSLWDDPHAVSFINKLKAAPPEETVPLPHELVLELDKLTWKQIPILRNPDLFLHVQIGKRNKRNS